MKRKIKILGVAPYEGLSLLMNQIADKRDDVELHVVYGNMEQGVELVRSLDMDYDVIISRARTADLILSYASIPVIDIGISHYDMLRCMKQAENSGNQYAIVGFHALTSIARLICDLMQNEVKIFPVSTQDNVETVLQDIKARGYTAIICDTQSYTKAKRLGITPILLTSGEDSVNEAIDKAVRQFKIQQDQLATIDILKNMLGLDGGFCVALDGQGTLVYSTAPPWQMESLIDGLGKDLTEPEGSYYMEVEDIAYAVTYKAFVGLFQSYTLFHLKPTAIPLVYAKHGVRILDKKKADSNFINSFYSYSKLSYDLFSSIEKINESPSAVMIIGEVGTGKDRVAEVIYTKSGWSGRPLYVVNCGLIADKDWAFLMEHHNSPVTHCGNTIYFSNINGLSGARQKQLLTLISHTDFHKRNRVIFSFSYSGGQAVPHVVMRFVNMTGSHVIHIPSLRESKDDIASSASLYLDSLNQTLVKQVVGFEKDAMVLLKQYSWPCNRTQFKRVLKEVITMTQGAYVTGDTVSRVLKRENYFDHQCSFLTDGEGSAPMEGMAIPLDGSFEEINREIARLVVQRCDGNQTTAAKQLNISRTTLWRLLSKS